MATTLNARSRETSGKGAARKLRSAGEIPAIAYGHGQECRSLSINTHEIELLLGTVNPDTTIIELKVDGAQSIKALIREVQHHPSRPQLLHVDFFQIKAGEKILVDVPIRLHGAPIGVRDEGGVLNEVLRELSVECLPEDIPSSIDLDVDNLGLGDTLHVSDVKLEKATIMNDPELVICSVQAPSVMELPEVEGELAEGGEPEVIGGAAEGKEAAGDEE